MKSQAPGNRRLQRRSSRDRRDSQKHPDDVSLLAAVVHGLQEPDVQSVRVALMRLVHEGPYGVVVTNEEPMTDDEVLALRDELINFLRPIAVHNSRVKIRV